MEKKIYFTPEVKFHQLRVKSMIAVSDGDTGSDQVGDGDETCAKGGMLFFDEDED
jgi:hypothetical protein